MSTDKIQTKIFERADNALNSEVDKRIAELRSYTRSAGARSVRIPFSYEIVITKADGFTLKDDDSSSALAKSTIAIPLDKLLDSLRTALFDCQQTARREAEVDEFFAKLDRLRNDIDDLQSRVE